MMPLLTVARSPNRLVKRKHLAPFSWQDQVHRRCIGSSSSTPTSSSSETASKATDDAITVDGKTEERSTLAAQCVQPRPIFPWRSSPEPLPRLIEPMKPKFHSNNNADSDDEQAARLDEYYQSDYFTKGGPLGQGWISPMNHWFRTALYANSMYLLGLSWPSIIIPWTRNDWLHEMEWSFCHAFSNGVSGMIQDTYILPSNKLGDEKKKEGGEQEGDEESEYDVNVDVTLDPMPLTEKNGSNTEGKDSNNKVDQGEISKEDEQYCMLQRNLREVYQSARKHSHPSKVNIVLRTVPQSAKIESIFPVFGLSRKLVDDHPNLRHTYRNLMKGLDRKSKEAALAGKKRLNPVEVGMYIMKSMVEVLERSAKLSGDGHASITIVAQVSINCKEVFCVRDVESGEIIQGYGDGQPRDVTHLVRFEMVVTENVVEPSDTILGRWQITDWDDIIDGNVFFT